MNRSGYLSSNIDPTIDFDREIDRSGTSSLKWERYQDRDVLPLWVVGTDSSCPRAVQEALHERVAHGVFGYTVPPDELVAAVVEHFQCTYRGHVDPSWPGLPRFTFVTTWSSAATMHA